MKFKVMPPFFFVRIDKKIQQEKKEKIGSLYLPPNEVFMTRNMQVGKIIDIGRDAHKYFPEAEIGDTAILHHFIENKDIGFFIDEDEKYNYYITTVFDYMEVFKKQADEENKNGTIPSYAGKGNKCYGVIKKDGRIIPNREYIFLQTEQKAQTDLPELELLSPLKGEGAVFKELPLTLHSSGLIIPKEWKETRTDTENRMKKIQAEIDNLAQTKLRKEVKEGIEKKEAELAALSHKINSKRYEPYKVEFINPETKDKYHCDQGDTLYCLNIACKTKVEVNGNEYIVAQTKYIGVPEKWAKESVS